MAEPRTFGVVLFKGFELLDVFGPLEAWGMLAVTGQCKVTTVAQRSGAVTSAQGPKAIADYGFADCPNLDLILIPGGIGTREEISNQLLLDWLKARAEKAEGVTTVCTGTAILARTGLLDGHRATTNKRAFKWVAEQGPKVNRLIGDVLRLFHRHEVAGVGYIDDLRGFELIRNFSRKSCAERVGARAEHYQQRNFATENSLESVEVGGGFVQLRFNFGRTL
jgi:putative intracellular protease/amidase